MTDSLGEVVVPVKSKTKYGFTYGPMVVDRIFHDSKYGFVITVRNVDGRSVEVRVSPTGKVMDVYCPKGMKVVRR
jgi:hypothetical protein